MAAKRGKVPIAPGQAPKDATLMDVAEAKEPWSEYHLGDGTVIKLKQVVAEVWRVDDEYDNEGNPVYVVKSSGMLNVLAPDELKRKKH